MQSRIARWTLVGLWSALAQAGYADDLRPIPLRSQAREVQPMTGIVLWTTNAAVRTAPIQLEYSYLTSVPIRRWGVSVCQCSFCRGHGIRLTSDPAGQVHFRFIHPQYLRRYRFGLRTADFVICKECGTCVGAVLLSGRGAQAAINVNTLREAPSDLPSGKPVSYDGESIEGRRARRIESWTPVTGPV